MGENTFFEIVSFLRSKNVSFEPLVHEHVHHSVDAAKIRGNTVEQAAKAIILKVKCKKSKEYRFIECVVPGHKKIDMKKLKKLLSLESASLASPEEVLEKTSCTVGSVPPFGFLFGLEVYADSSLSEQEFIFFSAGTHFDSIKIRSRDYLEAVKPLLLDFV
ncbi:MAG: YbaK/EbsC family protein [Candidatus Nanoarchaeia archaeon]